MRDADASIPAVLDSQTRAGLPPETLAFFEGLHEVLTRGCVQADRGAIFRGLVVLGQVGARLTPGPLSPTVILLSLYRDWLRYLRYALRADAATRDAVDAEVAAQLREVELVATLAKAEPQGRA